MSDAPEFDFSKIKLTKKIVPIFGAEDLTPLIHYPETLKHLQAEAVKKLDELIQAQVLSALGVPAGILNCTTASTHAAMHSTFKPLGVSAIAQVMAEWRAMEAAEATWPCPDSELRRRLASEFGDTDPRTDEYR